MIVAVTCENDKVFSHYGDTREFKLYEIEDNKVLKSWYIESGEYSHHTLATLLHNNNVNVLLCGRIGQPAVITLSLVNIKVYDLNEGLCDDVIKNYLSGNVSFSGGHECHH